MVRECSTLTTESRVPCTSHTGSGDMALTDSERVRRTHIREERRVDIASNLAEPLLMIAPGLRISLVAGCAESDQSGTPGATGPNGTSTECPDKSCECCVHGRIVAVSVRPAVSGPVLAARRSPSVT